MVAFTVYLGISAVLLIIAYFRFIFRIRRDKEPPYLPGHFLWGNAADFAEHAVHFINRSRKEFGDVFTIRVLNMHVTVIADPHAYETFTQDKRFDFGELQKQVTTNVFHCDLKRIDKFVDRSWQWANGTYLNKIMKNFDIHLQDALHDVGESKESENGLLETYCQWRTEKLVTFTSLTLWRAIFYSMFGRKNSSNLVPEVQEFTPLGSFNNLSSYHRFFNYLWLGVPVRLIPRAFKARKALNQQPRPEVLMAREGISDYIKLTSELLLNNDHTDEDVKGHNVIMMHISYNVFLIVYWCIYFMLEHKKVLAALKHELLEVIKAKEESNDLISRFTSEEINNLPILDSFLKETFRKTSGVYVMRCVKEDSEFQMPSGQTFRVRKGDRLAMYPPAFHFDPEIFENPETFKYDRFVGAKFFTGGKELNTPIAPFGSLCPGKRMAILEAKWFIMNIISSLDMELPEGEKTVPDKASYGHEILSPLHDVNVKFRSRVNGPKLAFASRSSSQS